MAVKLLKDVSRKSIESLNIDKKIYDILKAKETVPYTLQLYASEINSTSILQYFELIIGPEFTLYNNYFPDMMYKDNIIKGLIMGLEAIHNKNIIHCDIKPPNILIDITTKPPRPKYIDFGGAVRAYKKDRECLIIENGKDDARLGLVGTPRYLCKNEGFNFRTARSDIYALFMSLRDIYGRSLYNSFMKEQDIHDLFIYQKSW